MTAPHQIDGRGEGCDERTQSNYAPVCSETRLRTNPVRGESAFSMLSEGLPVERELHLGAPLPSTRMPSIPLGWAPRHETGPERMKEAMPICSMPFHAPQASTWRTRTGRARAADCEANGR